MSRYAEPAALEELHRRSRKGLDKMYSHNTCPMCPYTKEKQSLRVPEDIRLDKKNLNVGETYEFYMKDGARGIEPITMKFDGYFTDYHSDGRVEYVSLIDSKNNRTTRVLSSINFVTPTSSYGGKRKQRYVKKTKSKTKSKKNKKRTRHRRY